MAMLAIGPHVFSALPLSIQKLRERTRMRWPATPRFGAAPARQNTGRGEDEFDIEGLYFEEEWGGHADYLALKSTQLAGEPVELIGWAAGGLAAEIFGSVVVLEVGADHTYLGQNGIGRKTEFSVKLGSFGGDIGGLFGGLF